MNITRRPLIGLAIMACQAASMAAAEGTSDAANPPQPTPAATPVVTNSPALPWRRQATGSMRLGDWIAESLGQLNVPGRKSADAPLAYEAGLMWLSREELPAQRALARQVQDAVILQQARGRLAEPAALSLGSFFADLPVTGRVPVPVQDARVLQARTELDPLVTAGDELVVPPRPDTVTVLRDDGKRCELSFRAGQGAADYLARCAEVDTPPPAVDEVWLVQPDGHIARIGVVAWNGVPSDPPAPGAWLWAPARAADWPERSNRFIADLLATQGPSGVGSVSQPRPAKAPARTGLAVTVARDMPRVLPLSASDWGITGLLQTPSSRMPPAGTVRITLDRTDPYTQYTATLSPFDAVEIGVRYTSVGNQPYGPVELSGNQSYKDKSSDIKLRLMREDAFWPEVAVGLRDPGGTGLFAGEYLVGSKRYGDLDFSLGIGWGYLGARGNLRNPLAILGSRFDHRASTDIGAGGTAHFSTLFTGRTALFGGVQWQTPLEPLLVKVELDGNNYSHEPFGNNLDARWPVNLGVVWRSGPFALMAGLERGQKWSLGLSMQTGIDQLGMPKSAAPNRVPVDDAYLQAAASATTAAAAEPAADVPTGTAALRLLGEISEQTGWAAIGLSRDGSDWVVHLDDARGFYIQERLDRGIAVLHRDAPASVRGFRIVMASRQVPVTQWRIDRADWVIARTRWVPEARRVDPMSAADDRPVPAMAEAPALPALPRSVNLGFQQNVGGPDGYLYALTLRGGGQWRLWPGGWAHGAVDFRLIDNYNHFHYTAPSGLPRVRTYLREYLTTTRLTVPNLQVNQLSRLDDNTFGLAYAGLLESMFAGVGGEVLWRPPASAWGVGVDVNAVRQRGFEQHLALRDYQVVTGHATVYWDTGWHDVLAEVSAGRYLAGDKGATLNLSRVFDNGARMGLWVTKTNVSSAQFGEGSFDKGVYFSIPFDAFVSSWSGQSVTVAWQPLIRDGGAKLQRAQTLWGLTQARDRQALRYRSAVTGD